MPRSGTEIACFTKQEGGKNPTQNNESLLLEKDHYHKPSASRITHLLQFLPYKKEVARSSSQSGSHNVLGTGVLAAGKVCGLHGCKGALEPRDD